MSELVQRELTALREQVRSLTSRLEALEDRERPRPTWRARLLWLLGNRLTAAQHYAPRPLRLPGHYTRQALPTAPPVISIVTPSYQQGAFLERTLRSVLSQNYPCLQYAVQDGGSTDETVGVLEAHAARLHHLESGPDGGQADAINRGFAHTSGEVMAYLNSDDLLLPGALAYVAGYFAAHPEIDVLYSHRITIDADDQEIGRWILPPHSAEMLRWADFVPQETLFWRRRVWDAVGARIDDSFQFALDWDLLLRFQQAGARIVRVPRFLGAFRVHTTQKTSTLIGTTGLAEMARLRERTHGRTVTPAEIRSGLVPYMLRQAVYHRLYTLGLLPT